MLLRMYCGHRLDGLRFGECLFVAYGLLESYTVAEEMHQSSGTGSRGRSTGTKAPDGRVKRVAGAVVA